MLNNYLINKKVLITKLQCTVNSDIQNYSQQIGIIKGTKTLKNNLIIYLIESLNHNKIWVMAHEIQTDSKTH